MVNQEAYVKCDNCSNEFFLKAVGINEAIIELNGVSVTLVYFACPKCNKIYRVSIQDKRYYEMKEDLEKASNRLRKAKCGGNNRMADLLYSMVMKKAKRLRTYIEKVEKAFPGTFVFVASENNHKEKIIKYLP